MGELKDSCVESPQDGYLQAVVVAGSVRAGYQQSQHWIETAATVLRMIGRYTGFLAERFSMFGEGLVISLQDYFFTLRIFRRLNSLHHFTNITKLNSVGDVHCNIIISP